MTVPPMHSCLFHSLKQSEKGLKVEWMLAASATSSEQDKKDDAVQS